MQSVRLCGVVALVALAAKGSSAVEYEYRVSSITMSNAGAKDFCQQGFLGELASIESNAERNLIKSLTTDVTSNSNYWIGLERAPNTAMGWEYNDGAQVQFTFGGDSVWSKGEPNNHKRKENCVAVKANGKWNDAECDRNFYAMCKRVRQTNPFLGDGWIPRAAGTDDGQPINCYYKYYNNILKKSRTPWQRKTWFDAEGMCNSVSGLGGQPHLASITSNDENNFVRDMLTNTYMEWSNRPVWIGGRKTGDKWEWSSGEDMQYLNWLPGEPTHTTATREGPGEERCTQMSHSYVTDGGKGSRKEKVNPLRDMGNDSSEWNDASCYKSRGYVCELCSTQH